MQWKYDQTTATYLLLLAKKHSGRPVRLVPDMAPQDIMFSPIQDGRVRNKDISVLACVMCSPIHNNRVRNIELRILSLVFDFSVFLLNLIGQTIVQQKHA